MTTTTIGAAPFFQFQNIEMEYDPYPIGYIPTVFKPEIYDQLAATYPAMDLFKYMPELGRKYSLSQVNNRGNYFKFLETTPIWKQLYDEVKSKGFVDAVVDSLSAHKVDVGLAGRYEVINGKEQHAFDRRLRNAIETFKKGYPSKIGIKTRFEFSVMPADQGHIRPHTDAANKLITLVVSCITDGEWKPEYGGGTAMLRPTDLTENYNHNNRYLDFEKTEVIKTFPFVPNQCVVFVKTFNSLHSVHPMTGIGSNAMRKTLTINIELDSH